MGKKKKPFDKFHRHQAIEITNLSSEILQRRIQESAYYQSGVNPEFNEQIDNAVSALETAYQMCNKAMEVYVKSPSLFTKPVPVGQAAAIPLQSDTES